MAWPNAFPLQHPMLGMIIGVRGSGKSWRGKLIANGWKGGKVLALDPVAPTPPTTDYIAHYADYYGATVAEAMPGGVIPTGVDLIVADEADRFLPLSRRNDPILEDLVVRGRHRGVSLVLITQRPAKIDYDCWGMMNWLVIFQTIAKRDVDRVCEHTPDLEEYRDLLPYLPVGVAVEWSAREGCSPTPAELVKLIKSTGGRLPPVVERQVIASARQMPLRGK